MKTKILILTSFLMTVFLVLGPSFATAQSATTNKRILLKSPVVVVPPEALGEISDFATTLKANPIDVNKDGAVDAYDTVSAQAGYALAIKYANSLPAALRSGLDVNRDGKVTKLDLTLVAGNIAKAAAIYERVNVPSFNFVDMPAFSFIFRGEGNQMIVTDSAQTFESIADFGASQPVDVGEVALAKLDVNADGAVNEADAIVFGDLSTVIERVNYANFNFTGDKSRTSDQNWIVVYNSNITPEARAKLDLQKAEVLDAGDAQIFSNLISKMATVIDYVKYATGADVFTLTDYSKDKDGNIQVSFEAEQGHALTIVIGVDTGVILNSAETLSTYGDKNALTVSESATRVYDSNGILQKAEYSAKSYDSGGMLVSHIVESVKLDTASGAMENSYTEATNIDAAGTILVEVAESTVYDANGKVTGSSVTESHYSASGILIERTASITIPDSGSQPGTGTTLLVQYAMDATGAVISTTVYNDKGEEIEALGGEGYKDSSSIVTSVKATQEAELKAAADLKAAELKVATDLKAAKEAADLKVAKEAADLKVAKEAADLKVVKEAADLKAAQEAETARVAADKAAADLKASQEAEAAKVAAEQKASQEAADLKAAADKAAADKVIADKAAELKASQEAADLKAAADKAAADKVVADKIAADKAAADKVIADKAAELKTSQEAAKVAAEQKASQEAADLKAAADKAAADKAVADKAAADLKASQEAETARVAAEQKAAKEAADKAAADKAVADKAAADKAIADKIAADKVIADKAAADKAVADKAAADKAIADKIAADKAAADKVIADKAAADLKAAKETADLKAAKEAAELKAAKDAERIAAETEMAKRLHAEILLAQEKIKAAKEAADLKAAKEAADKAAADKAVADKVVADKAAADLKAAQEAVAAKIAAEHKAAQEAEAARLIQLAKEKNMSNDPIIAYFENLLNKVVGWFQNSHGSDNAKTENADLQSATNLVNYKIKDLVAKADENIKTTDSILAVKIANPLEREALTLQDKQASNKTEVKAPGVLLPESELAQRKTLEAQVAKRSGDKRFNGEMAKSTGEKTSYLMKKKWSK